LLAQGQQIEELCRHHEITESTFHRWCNQYGGMKADDAKRLKDLERENARSQSSSATRRSTSTC
jgi:transposase-like protein